MLSYCGWVLKPLDDIHHLHRSDAAVYVEGGAQGSDLDVVTLSHQICASKTQKLLGSIDTMLKRVGKLPTRPNTIIAQLKQLQRQIAVLDVQDIRAHNSMYSLEHQCNECSRIINQLFLKHQESNPALEHISQQYLKLAAQPDTITPAQFRSEITQASHNASMPVDISELGRWSQAVDTLRDSISHVADGVQIEDAAASTLKRYTAVLDRSLREQLWQLVLLGSEQGHSPSLSTIDAEKAAILAVLCDASVDEVNEWEDAQIWSKYIEERAKLILYSDPHVPGYHDYQAVASLCEDMVSFIASRKTTVGSVLRDSQQLHHLHEMISGVAGSYTRNVQPYLLPPSIDSTDLACAFFPNDLPVFAVMLEASINDASATAVKGTPSLMRTKCMGPKSAQKSNSGIFLLPCSSDSPIILADCAELLSACSDVHQQRLGIMLVLLLFAQSAAAQANTEHAIQEVVSHNPDVVEQVQQQLAAPLSKLAGLAAAAMQAALVCLGGGEGSNLSDFRTASPYLVHTVIQAKCQDYRNTSAMELKRYSETAMQVLQDLLAISKTLQTCAGLHAVQWLAQVLAQPIISLPSTFDAWQHAGPDICDFETTIQGIQQQLQGCLCFVVQATLGNKDSTVLEMPLATLIDSTNKLSEAVSLYQEGTHGARSVGVVLPMFEQAESWLQDVVCAVTR